MKRKNNIEAKPDSHLSCELRAVLAKSGISVDQVAVDSGISRGLIYKWLNAGQTSISVTQIHAIARAVGCPKAGPVLMLAHLRDEAGPAGEYITLTLKKRPSRQADSITDLAARNPAVRRVLDSLVECLKK